MAGKSADSDEIIFLLREDGLTLAGLTQILHMRVAVPEADVTLDGGEAEVSFGVKLRVLNSYLDTFKSLYRTRADKVTFTNQDRRMLRWLLLQIYLFTSKLSALTYQMKLMQGCQINFISPPIGYLRSPKHTHLS